MEMTGPPKFNYCSDSFMNDLRVLMVTNHHILDGSPPCPPFSMSGTKQKGWNKEKTAYGMKLLKNIEDLTWEHKIHKYIIVGDLKPRVVVCENVKGLTMDYARDHLNRMVKRF